MNRAFPNPIRPSNADGNRYFRQYKPVRYHALKGRFPRTKALVILALQQLNHRHQGPVTIGAILKYNPMLSRTSVHRALVDLHYEAHLLWLPVPNAEHIVSYLLGTNRPMVGLPPLAPAEQREAVAAERTLQLMLDDHIEKALRKRSR
ncbi:hypothetical protein [Pseudomonas paracarnis]|uniref:hypothetical protein n=1 Tax=Pseudomonas paracarnis TaxID=2750625 RepID=UPI00191AA372|nr:hypothetical protein [Pseudomonas paracarnis]